MSEYKKINLHNPFLYAAIMAVGMFLGYKMKGSLLHQKSDGNVAEIIKLVNERYVDSVATDSVEMNAIDQLLAQLDPHSVYIPPQDLKGVDEDLDGEFDGIGIEYYMQKDTLMVTSVISGGPSEIVGIQTGDKFIKVDDSLIAGVKISNDGIAKKLRGLRGTEVRVEILRNKKLLKEIVITRDVIPMHSVDASYMMDATTGYIKINRFAASTASEFNDALKNLLKNGMQQLMLDLRDNPGGYMEAAVQIADELIAGKKKIVYTKGRKNANDTYMAERKGLFETGKIVVLIDEGSASASEVLSGALQDYDRATIVGRRSFGKGLVQEQFPLSNGGALRLTIARYYIPSGRCIQKDYSEGKENYYEDIEKRFKHGELANKDSVNFKDTTIYKTMGGRTVYGGGGIMPDVFVPIIKENYSESLSYLVRNGILNESINEYLIAQKENLSIYKNENEFNEKFKVDANLILFLKEKSLSDTIDIACFNNTKDLRFIKARVKSQLAKSLFGSNAQFKVLNSEDDIIIKAKEQFLTK
jgi:carboxyl-terminal processing protease